MMLLVVVQEEHGRWWRRSKRNNYSWRWPEPKRLNVDAEVDRRTGDSSLLIGREIERVRGWGWSTGWRKMMVFWLKMVAVKRQEGWRWLSQRKKKQTNKQTKQEDGLEISERREEVSMESGLKCGSFLYPKISTNYNNKNKRNLCLNYVNHIISFFNNLPKETSIVTLII